MLFNMNQVGQKQAPALAGQFASCNPRRIALAGENGLVAGDDGTGYGTAVARFVWIQTQPGDQFSQTGEPMVCTNRCPTATPNVAPLGVAHRDQSVNFPYIKDSESHYLKSGKPIDCLVEGEIWIYNASTTDSVTLGMKAYARRADGRCLFDISGQLVTGAVETAWYACSSADPLGLVKISTHRPAGLF